MNQSSERVLHYLAGDENIEVVSINDLQNLSDEAPYFAVAHFLLAKKLHAENNSSFLPQLQKTALYFSNPFWLQYQLTDEPEHEFIPAENNFIIHTEKKPSSATALPEDEQPHITASFSDNSIESNVVNQPFPLKNEFAQHIQNEEQVETSHKTPESRVIKSASLDVEKADQQEEEMAAITRGTDIETKTFLDEVSNTENATIGDNIQQVSAETQIPGEAETTEVLEEMAGVSRETGADTEAFLNEIGTSAEENDEQNLEMNTESFAADTAPQNEQSTTPDEHEIMFQNIKAMLDATSEEADADTENTVIPIDPYYTIDYFASQGIKLDLDQNPKDDLGQHLKKFTQWLKHMKKLGPEDATEVIGRTETDADIQKIADSSNTVREVVTEAMASVLEKQGKNNKAIELYNKLSFLNPDKSAYFAAKIKNLKGS
jgi:hypothetical protein